MTDILEKTEEDFSRISPDDPSNAAHYFKVADLDALTFGEKTSITALCGYTTGTIYRAINGRPVCSKCALIHAGDIPMSTGDLMRD